MGGDFGVWFPSSSTRRNHNKRPDRLVRIEEVFGSIRFNATAD
jgi:hypothetical protein